MYRANSRLGARARTLGVLLDWLGDPYQEGILRGVSAAARTAGAQLLCFLGGGLPGPEGAVDARHRLFELVTERCVDGVLLLSSTLSHNVGAAGVGRFAASLRGLPACSIGVELAGLPSVVTDNDAGMRECVAHLIREHGAQRLALVRGPLANDEAEVRAAAFRETLAANGIPYDARRVVVGDFMEPSGRAAVVALERQCGPIPESLDAIVVCNDAMALGVLSALEERGIAVPEAVAVTGFDDTEEARLLQPPLTTVRQPLEQLGARAVQIVLEAVQHGAHPERIQLATDVTLRRSCGCSGWRSPMRAELPPSSRRLSFEASLLMRRQTILDELARAAHGHFGAAGPDWQARLLNSFVDDIGDPDSDGFVPLFQDIMSQLPLTGTDLNVCDDVINVLREQLLPWLENHQRPRAEDMFHQARRVVSSTIQRILARERLYLGRRGRTLSAVCGTLAMTFDYSTLAERALTELPKLGIVSAFLVIYDDVNPSTARLLAGYDQRSQRQWRDDAHFEGALLLPRNLVSADRDGRSYVVAPLIWKQQSLGHLLLEFDLEHASYYGAIAEALSAALRGAQLEQKLALS